MSLEEEIRQAVWDAVSESEPAKLAALSGGEDLTVMQIVEVQSARLGAIEAGLLRVAREVDHMRTLLPIEDGE